MIGSFAGSLLRRELDRVPLWLGDHITVKQIVDDFVRYLYLLRLQVPEVLYRVVADGARLLTWERDGYDYDEVGDRYVGLRGDQRIALDDTAGAAGGLVKPDAARRELAAEQPDVGPGREPEPQAGSGARSRAPCSADAVHGTVQLDTMRAGRSASRIARRGRGPSLQPVAGQVTVSLEIQAA